jgi:hypothetical protein
VIRKHAKDFLQGGKNFTSKDEVVKAIRDADELSNRRLVQDFTYLIEEMDSYMLLPIEMMGSLEFPPTDSESFFLKLANSASEDETKKIIFDASQEDRVEAWKFLRFSLKTIAQNVLRLVGEIHSETDKIKSAH